MSRDAVTALCRGAVDYAGTFPPAKLDLPEACGRFARYRSGEDAWMLNRFVVAALDLDALAEHVPAGSRWPVSVVCRDRDAVSRAQTWHGDAVDIASLETVDVVDSKGEVFVERALPVENGDLEALRERGMRLKIRLGGATIPSSSAVARILTACTRLDLAIKATAGLHRAIRAEAHGFVNLMLAATLARMGGDVEELEALLDETDADAFGFENDTISWRGRRFDVAAIQHGRSLFRSFGSCSFEEPVESLGALGLAP